MCEASGFDPQHLKISKQTKTQLSDFSLIQDAHTHIKCMGASSEANINHRK